MEAAKKETIMVRTCLKCREFVIIEPNNPKNQAFFKMFEKNHKGHNLITSEHEELQVHYKEFNWVFYYLRICYVRIFIWLRR